MDDGLLAKNPALAVEKPRRQPSPRRALTSEEITDVDAVTRAGGNDLALDLYWFAYTWKLAAVAVVPWA